MILGTVEGSDPAAVARVWVAQFRTVDADGNVVEPDVETVRTAAVDAVLQWRGAQREALGLSEAKWQELAYIGKAQHCREWLADQSQPFALHREATARGMTNEALAALVLAQNDAWLDANDQIDAAYAAARAAIEAAQSVAEIEAVLAGLEN